MDHLPIPPSGLPNAVHIPLLCSVPQPDDSRADFDYQVLCIHQWLHDAKSGEISEQQWTEREALTQQWLWFGLLEEFGKAFDLDIDLREFVHENPASDSSPILNTICLLKYSRRALLVTLAHRNVPLDLRVGDRVFLEALANPNDQEPTLYGPDVVTKICANLDVDIQVKGEKRTRRMTVGSLVRPPEDQPSYARQVMQKIMAGVFDEIPMYALKVAIEVKREKCCVMHDEGRYLRLARRLDAIWKLNEEIVVHASHLIRWELPLSIAILCENLNEILTIAYKELFGLQKFSLLADPFALQEYMQENNWCSSRLKDFDSMSFTNQYVFATLPSYEPMSHEDCMGPTCSHRPKATDELQAKHSQICHGCDIIEFNESELISILRSGGIPGIIAHHSHSYQIVDISARPFVAISHVWAHGLGNPSSNALPACQIEGLFQMIQSLSEGCALWVDTLTVPIDAEFKRVAIMQLRRVYTEADRVLVVDKHVMKSSSHWLEARFQLLHSEWMKRLWTLQEGRLPQSLYIQFRDEALPIRDLYMREDMDFSLYDAGIFCNIFHESSEDIHRFMFKASDTAQLFANLADTLAARSVTVPNDEPICLATLLGLSLEDYDPYPTMEDVYRSVRTVPAGLLFSPHPRLQAPGFRWAPTTLLDTDNYDVSKVFGLGQWTLSGLCIRTDCLSIVWVPEAFSLPTSRSEMYIAKCADDSNFAVHFTVPTDCNPEMMTKSGILLSETLSQDPLSTRSSWGVLVNQCRQVNDVVHCRYVTRVVVHKLDSQYHRLRNMNGQPEADLQAVRFTAEYRSSQDFCVD